MPTENRRVATYLPKELDDRLKTFIVERELKGESQALIVILSEFFGVSYTVARQVDYSGFVKAEQFSALESKVLELAEVIDKSSSPGVLLTKLLERFDQLEKRLQVLELAKNEKLTLTTGELAKRLTMPASTLSHWKGDDPKRNKSPDELLKATREKDPDKIGWILLPAINRFKPERELPISSLEAHQHELPIDS
jgi:hypothetical protein